MRAPTLATRAGAPLPARPLSPWDLLKLRADRGATTADVADVLPGDLPALERLSARR